MGGTSSEPMDSIVVKEPVRIPDSKLIEKVEKDPLITEKPEDVRLISGESHTFRVAYQADHQVNITLRARKFDGTPIKGGPRSTNGCQRNAYFSFDITQAKSHHSGRYTVEIFDPSLPKRHGANPAVVSCSVRVEDSSWCAFS
ncbi:uncharacterized protein LOC119723362 [Patiria miniata]|uniref:Uncharacterized protein n=1 Tax=Patiria miniata TaxID=46514 RepID=A0A913ZFX3_PATMI|nr:uncharacterized protein LOC119723362 [Patiria miniata]